MISRPINIERLEKDLKLKIENYSKTPDLREKILSYHHMLLDYILKNGARNFYHTRKQF
jgi:hypothetical protein